MGRAGPGGNAVTSSPNFTICMEPDATFVKLVTLRALAFEAVQTLRKTPSTVA